MRRKKRNRPKFPNGYASISTPDIGGGAGTGMDVGPDGKAET